MAADLPEGETEANVQFIAAAPDMEAALAGMLRSFERSDMGTATA